MQDDKKINSQALILAAEENDVAMLYALIDKVDLNITTADLRHTALMQTSSVEFAEILIKNKADIEVRNLWGESALAKFAKEGHLLMVDLLIAQGANVNALDDNQHSALSKASNYAVCAALIKAGANINSINSIGHSVLMLKAIHDHVPVAILLIESGVNINYIVSFKFPYNELEPSEERNALSYTKNIILIEALLKAGSYYIFPCRTTKSVIDNRSLLSMTSDEKHNPVLIDHTIMTKRHRL